MASDGKLSVYAVRAVTLLAMILLTCVQAEYSQAVDDLRKSASWNWPESSIYDEQLRSYLDQQAVAEDTRQEIAILWLATQGAKGPELLDCLLSVGSAVEPKIRELNDRLGDPTSTAVHPTELSWLTTDVPGWMQDTIRLACGRAFAQRKMYDEAIESLSGLELAQVCDPASLIFYRAVCEHHLMKRTECLRNIEVLLEREDELPVRFAQVARLMRADIEPFKVNSLDEISRLMRDVQRRLALGRAGMRVRDEEQDIVDKLDKLIDKIEQQMQQQRQQQQSGQDGKPQQGQANPMDDSQIAGGGGPGDVDNKDIGDRAGWGNLPPAQRQESLQRLTEELPSHYREVIEGYFRQLAKDKR